MSAYATQMSEITKSIVTVVQMMRGGTAIASMNDFAYHLWNIQGYLQGVTLGQPSGTEVLAGSIAADSQNRVQLEDLKCLANVESMVVYGSHDKAQISPIQLISLAKLVFDMLRSLGIFDKNEKKETSGPTNLDQQREEDTVATIPESFLALAKKADHGDDKAIKKMMKDATDAGFDPDTYDTFEGLAQAMHAKPLEKTK